MFTTRRAIVTVCLLLLACSAAEAVTSKRQRGSIEIRHSAGHFVSEFKGKTATDALGDIEFDIHPHETVEISVVDPNPLLFTFKWKGTVSAPSSDYAAAKDFATALGKLAEALGPVAALAPAARTPNPLDSLIIRPEFASLKLPTGYFDETRKAIQRLEDAVEAIPQLIRDSAEPSKEAAVKATVAGWRVKQLETSLDKAWTSLDFALDALLLIQDGPPPPTGGEIARVTTALLLLSSRQSHIERSADMLSAFDKDVGAIGVKVALGSVSYKQDEDQTSTIEIEAVSANASIARKTGRKTGEMKVVLKPYRKVRLGFGGSVVYSLVDEPEFVAEDDGAGQFTIVKKNDEDAGENVAAMLTLTPAAWDDPGFGGNLQIGFNPEKDRLAFFLGGGVRVKGAFSVGAGVTYREVRKLGSGLQPDQTISSPSDLKLDTEFDSGLYISFTYSK